MIKNEDLAWLKEMIGQQLLEKIIDYAGGTQIYIPKRETIERPLRDKAVLQEYNGYNTKQLARKYGVTERTIRRIVNVSREKQPTVCSSIKMQADEEAG